MSFRVEDPVVEGDGAGVIREEEEEVLERLSQEEALHLVSVIWVCFVRYVVYGGVTTTFQPCVPIECLCGNKRVKM